MTKTREKNEYLMQLIVLLKGWTVMGSVRNYVPINIIVKMVIWMAKYAAWLSCLYCCKRGYIWSLMNYIWIILISKGKPDIHFYEFKSQICIEINGICLTGFPSIKKPDFKLIIEAANCLESFRNVYFLV